MMTKARDGYFYKVTILGDISHCNVEQWTYCKDGKGMIICGVVFNGTFFECKDYISAKSL